MRPLSSEKYRRQGRFSSCFFILYTLRRQWVVHKCLFCGKIMASAYSGADDFLYRQKKVKMLHSD